MPGGHRNGARFALLVTAGILAALAATSSAQAESGFVPGSGQARAQVLSIVPLVGGAELPIATGRARATYQSMQATADASTADLGLVGSILTLSICGGDPILTNDQLPHPLRVDSTSGEAADARDLTGIAGVGHEAATARPGARATADATPAELDLVGLVTIASGTAHSEAELVPDTERRARATSDVGAVSLLGGLVVLKGLHWEAEQRSGAEGTAPSLNGSFSVGSVVVAGVALPATTLEQLQGAIDAINAVTTPLFLTIVLPKVAADVDGRLTVSPLRIRLSGGATAAAALLPAAGQLGGARQALAQALLMGGCTPGVKGNVIQQLGGGATTVLDVVVAAALGNGGLSIDLGGVSAATDSKSFACALCSFAPGVAPVIGATPSAAARPALPAGAAVPAIAATSGHIGAASPAATAAPFSTTCETTHERGWPGCSIGHAPLVVILASVVTAGLIGADATRARRRRRATAEETSP